MFRVGTPEQLAGDLAEHFDAVWCSEVIEHVFDVWGFLTSVHRILAESGRLVLTTPYHGLVKNLALSLRGYANHYNPFGGHIRFFCRRSLERCLRHCGFAVEQWRGYGRFWPLYRSFFVVARKATQPLPRPPADS